MPLLQTSCFPGLSDENTGAQSGPLGAFRAEGMDHDHFLSARNWHQGTPLS